MKSTTPLREITAAARVALSGNWSKAIGGFFVWSLLIAGCCLLNAVLDFFCRLPPVGVFSWIVSGPLIVGLASFFLSVVQGSAQFSKMFDGFNPFWKSFAAYFMYILFIVLWTLLFMIPGIIKTYSYAMTFYILADDPTVGPIEAITRSRALMNGNKWKYAGLQCRFLGWGLLCLLTCGIGFIWLWPYTQTAMAAFYRDIQERA